MLALSTKWTFDSLRALAITRLEHIASPIDRIVLAKQYSINEWLMPAYIELAKRPASLTLAENQRLGMETVTLLANVRVALRGTVPARLPDAAISSTITQTMHQISAEQSAS